MDRLGAVGVLVAALREEGVDDVGQADDAAGQRNRVPRQAGRVPFAVPPLVVAQRDVVGHGDEVVLRVAEDVGPDERVLLDALAFLGRQRARLVQDVVGDAHLADVVHRGGALDEFHLAAVQAHGLGQEAGGPADAPDVLGGGVVAVLDHHRQTDDRIQMGLFQVLLQQCVVDRDGRHRRQRQDAAALGVRERRHGAGRIEPVQKFQHAHARAVRAPQRNGQDALRVVAAGLVERAVDAERPIVREVVGVGDVDDPAGRGHEPGQRLGGRRNLLAQEDRRQGAVAQAVVLGGDEPEAAVAVDVQAAGLGAGQFPRLAEDHVEHLPPVRHRRQVDADLQEAFQDVGGIVQDLNVEVVVHGLCPAPGGRGGCPGPSGVGCALG